MNSEGESNMVTVEINYEGDLRCQASHGPSKARFQTDAPTDNHGKGEAFSPTDLVGTALGTCILTIMGIAARERDVDLRGARAVVQKTMAKAPVRRIAHLSVSIHVPITPPKETRAALEQAGLGCPVKASLSEDVEVDVRFQWGS